MLFLGFDLNRRAVLPAVSASASAVESNRTLANASDLTGWPSTFPGVKVSAQCRRDVLFEVTERLAGFNGRRIDHLSIFIHEQHDDDPAG